MREAIIKIENVSKKFKLFYDRPLSLKERMVKGSKGAYREFYALSDVSFEVKKGSTVGLVGQNGCGKSTLLKIINRTMFPEHGKVTVKGKVASLIELGAGFHPELSGRENIYTNATVFGFSKEEIEQRIPDIIKFSELEEFIDNPIRTYSSGMYARLAFSVAINVDADILLVDEILGVGDMNFQAKCANKIFELRKKGITILLVTHDMGTIDRLCDYAVWLDHGKKMAEGEPKDIQNKYMAFMAERQQERIRKEEEEADLINSKTDDAEQLESITEEKEDNNSLGEHFGNRQLIFTECKLLNEKGTDKRSFQTGEDVRLYVKYTCQVEPEKINPNIGIEIHNSQGILVYGTNTTREGNRNLGVLKEGVVEVVFKDLKLIAGDYTIGIAITDESEAVRYDYYPNIVSFRMYSAVNDIGLVRINHEIYLDNQKIDAVEKY